MLKLIGLRLVMSAMSLLLAAAFVFFLMQLSSTDPVVLRDLQGMTTEEASAMLRVKDQTLKSRLHRGRLILRKQLADFAGGLTLHKPCYGC